MNSPVLSQNAPNPFNGTTEIQYFIPKRYQKAILQISNAQGQVIQSTEIQHKGHGQLSIKAGNLSIGNYFYSLLLDGQLFETKQLSILK